MIACIMFFAECVVVAGALVALAALLSGAYVRVRTSATMSGAVSAREEARRGNHNH